MAICCHCHHRCGLWRVGLICHAETQPQQQIAALIDAGGVNDGLGG
jgi:hypothetical protein